MSRLHRIVFRCTAEQKSRLAQFANRFDRSESDTCRWLLAEALQQFDAPSTVPISSWDDGLAKQFHIGALEPSVQSAADGSSVVMVLRLDLLPPSATVDAVNSSLPLRSTQNGVSLAEKGDTQVE